MFMEGSFTLSGKMVYNSWPAPACSVLVAQILQKKNKMAEGENKHWF